MAKHIDNARNLIEKDDPVLARAELETATFLDKLPQGDWEIHWLMARSYLKELPYADDRKVKLNLAYDQMTKALSSFRYAGNNVGRQENKIRCLACISWICMLKKDYPRAVYHLLVAKKEADELEKSYIRFLLGLAYLKHKQYDQSKNEFDELAKELSHHYVFRWNKIPGEHDGILKDFLTKEIDKDWKNTNKIEKSEDGLTITVSAKEKSISLSLKEDKVEIKGYKAEIERNTPKLDAKMESDESVIYSQPYRFNPSFGGKNRLKCSSEICLDPEEFKIYSDCLIYIYIKIYICFLDLERNVNIEDTWTCLDKINTFIDNNEISEKKFVESYLEHCRGWWLLDKCILEDKTHDDDQRIINVSIGTLSKIEKIIIIDGELTNFGNLDISCNDGTATLKNAKIKNFKIQDLKVKGKERHLIVDVEEATITKAQVECMQYYCDKSDQKELCTHSKHLKLKHTVLQDVEFKENSIKGIKIHRESMVNLAIEHLQRSLGLRADHYAYLHLAQAYELQMMWEKDEVKKAIIKKRAMDACQRCIDLDHYEEHIKEAQDLMKRLEGSQSASSPPQQPTKEEKKTKAEGTEKVDSTGSSEEGQSSRSNGT